MRSDLDGPTFTIDGLAFAIAKGVTFAIDNDLFCSVRRRPGTLLTAFD
jgi:hypothetical protein